MIDPGFDRSARVMLTPLYVLRSQLAHLAEIEAQLDAFLGMRLNSVYAYGQDGTAREVFRGAVAEAQLFSRFLRHEWLVRRAGRVR